MKKILLISLVLIGCDVKDVKDAPVYAESVDLKCDGVYDYEQYIHLSSVSSNRRGYASTYLVGFDEEGKANYLSKETSYQTDWGDEDITLKLFGKGRLEINRQTLTFWSGVGSLNPFFHTCEITEGVQAKAQQWEQEYQEHLNSKNKI